MDFEQRRKHKRINKRFPVYFGSDEPKFVGFAKDISLSGLQIASKTIFHPPSMLNILIRGDGEEISVTGIVQWATDTKRMASMGNLNQSMGIELVEPSEQYVDFLLKSIEKFSERRDEPRFGKEFKVVFGDAEKLVESYTQDISIGGMFVLSDDPPKLNSTIELSLVLPNTMNVIRVQCRVVHVVDDELAKSMGMNKGFAVQFVDFKEDDKRILDEYVAEMKRRME